MLSPIHLSNFNRNIASVSAIVLFSFLLLTNASTSHAATKEAPHADFISKDAFSALLTKFDGYTKPATNDNEDDDDAKRSTPAHPSSGAETLTRTLLLADGITTDAEDAYHCVYTSVPSGRAYIHHYEPRATAARVHHMILSLCPNGPPMRSPTKQGCMSPCGGPSTTLYAWAKDAPGLDLPSDTGIPVGQAFAPGSVFVLQLHFLKVVTEPDSTSGVEIHWGRVVPQNVAGIMLFGHGSRIPGGQPKATLTGGPCKFEPMDLYGRPVSEDVQGRVIAARVHGHRYIRMNGAFLSPSGSREDWQTIVERTPQIPQSFYPVEPFFPLSTARDDEIAFRCVYNTTTRLDGVPIGATHTDEMCNVYLLISIPTASARDGYVKFDPCWSMRNSRMRPPLPPAKAYNESLVSWMSDPAHHGHVPQTVTGIKRNGSGVKLGDAYHFQPKSDKKFGQIGGLTFVHESGLDDLIVFHRADHVWDASSFPVTNYASRPTAYNKSQRSIPIDTSKDSSSRYLPPIVKLACRDGTVLDSYGDEAFFLPHGVSVDKASPSRLWLTDVALHQAMLFDAASSRTSPVLSLGKKFGAKSPFCQPADITVNADSSLLFVADGYCNTRVVVYRVCRRDKSSPSDVSTVLLGYGGSTVLGPLSRFREPPLVHSVSLGNDDSTIFVADRERKRLLKFTIDHAALKARPGCDSSEATDEEPNDDDDLFVLSKEVILSGTVYAVRHFKKPAPQKKTFLAVAIWTHEQTLNLTILSGNSLSYVSSRVYPGVSRPHALAVSPDASYIAIGCLTPEDNAVYRIAVDTDTGSEQPWKSMHSGELDAPAASEPGQHAAGGEAGTKITNWIKINMSPSLSVVFVLCTLIPVLALIVTVVMWKCRSRSSSRNRGGGVMSVNRLLNRNNRGGGSSGSNGGNGAKTYSAKYTRLSDRLDVISSNSEDDDDDNVGGGTGLPPRGGATSRRDELVMDRRTLTTSA